MSDAPAPVPPPVAVPPGLLARLRGVASGFVLRAAAIALLFFVAEAAGFRGYVAVIASTESPAALRERSVEVVLAATYIVLYLAFVLLGPTLLIADVIRAVLRWLLIPKPGATVTAPNRATPPPG